VVALIKPHADFVEGCVCFALPPRCDLAVLKSWANKDPPDYAFVVVVV
jgi:hypothetical protein